MTLSTKREAFRVDTIARGLDHQRTSFLKSYGNRVAASATSFEAGQLVALDANGYVIVHPGSDTKPYGVTKYNKSTTLTAVISAEPITFPTALSVVTLANSNLVDHGTANLGGLKITSTAVGGTTYTPTTDFTYNSTNGTVTHVLTIPTATVVYAWYSYQLTAAQLLEDGQNFYNMQDDVTIQGGKVTVIEGPGSEIYTTQYNAARAWAINDNVTVGDKTTDYCGGLFDRATDSTNSTVIGRVVQLPTADDPYIGIRLEG